MTCNCVATSVFCYCYCCHKNILDICIPVGAVVFVIAILVQYYSMGIYFQLNAYYPETIKLKNFSNKHKTYMYACTHFYIHPYSCKHKYTFTYTDVYMYVCVDQQGYFYTRFVLYVECVKCMCKHKFVINIGLNILTEFSKKLLLFCCFLQLQIRPI